MTLNHLIFSAACAAYILLAVPVLEGARSFTPLCAFTPVFHTPPFTHPRAEPDLVAEFGEKYEEYQARTPMYCPSRTHSGGDTATFCAVE